MEPYEYETLYRLEDNYWWFRGLRDILIQVVKSLQLQPSSKVLDIGCGTGATLKTITDSFDLKGFGFDFSMAALPFLKERLQKNIGCCSVNSLPFKSSAFDVVFCIDVLESKSVDEVAAVSEMRRVLKTLGYMVLIVPAYRWLYTREHHAAVHAVRRYSQSDVIGMMKEENFEIKRATHLFSILFPLIVCYRLMLRANFLRKRAVPRSELRPLAGFLNSLFYQIVRLERILLKTMNFSWGSSILIVAQKTK